MMGGDLEELITPSLLYQLFQARMPWPRMEPITGTSLLSGYFGAETFAQAAPVAWPALIQISREHGPNKPSPDMSSLLPAPEAPSFPQQALGMQVLLDQCPRILFKGIDGRWTSHFDGIARRLYDFFYALPDDLRPWARARWPGVSFEYWFCAAWEFNVSMTHQESAAHHEVSVARTEELRRLVEEHAGVRDPVRDDDDDDDGREKRRDDLYGFPRLMRNLDFERRREFHETAFLFFEIIEVHKPIIDRFGRYPYRNAIEGRESTEGEVEWVEKTDHFAEAPLDVATRVRDDVKAGRWTPLGEGRLVGEKK